MDQIFPEYYLIKVNSFNDIAKDSLDEWIYFLKNEEIKEGFQARGLKKAKHELDIMKLPDTERRAYERHRENLHYRASMFESSYTAAVLEGRIEGKKEGLKEGEQRGEKKKALQIARKLLQTGTLDIKTIADMTEMTEEEVRALQTENDD
ncbi:MAG: hypothetical protein D3910_20825 [Candidatus Electrothrix sp. ATG2]|nr:hypothetical protein [Candidatus Electrothrix sp. ATG2]